MPQLKVKPARETTNARLGTERKNTDHALALRVAATDREAEEVVHAARRRAEEVLGNARERADEISQRSKLSADEQTAIGEERARNDAVRRQEYVRADERTVAEREERTRVVANLLDLGRSDTDAGLLLERAVADEVLSRREHFLGMVTHDLRNELAGIAMSVAEMVESGMHDDAGGKIFRTATNVQGTALRMSRLIGGLLDVASIEAGKFTIALAVHGVGRVVEDVIGLFQSIASAKEISLVGDTTTESVEAKFDRQRILQVLGNLLTNALRFTPQGGRVAVRTKRGRSDRGEETWFSVSDTGPGIPANRLDAIFERYEKGAYVDRQGLGLGLYISKSIVEAHGGRIWAENTASGSTFHFTLPDRPNT